MNQQEEQESIECPICDRPGKAQAVEGVPGDGILYECIHEDGKVCEWARFSGGLSSFKNIKADRLLSPEIECPQCGSKGVIKTERDDNNRPDRYSYRVSHPDGSRCFIRKENRAVILKALGRYIESAPEQQQEQQQQQPQQGEHNKTRKRKQQLEQTVCPVCEKIGGAALYDNRYVVVHQRGDGKNDQHLMRSLEQKIRFLKSVTSKTLNTFRKQELENLILREHNKELIKHLQAEQADASRLLKIGQEMYGGNNNNE